MTLLYLAAALAACALCAWAGFLAGRLTERQAQSAEAERIRRITEVPRPTHRGPANVDQPPSRITQARYRNRRRW